MAFGPDDLYQNFEVTANTLSELTAHLDALYENRIKALNTTWVYRGVGNADYGFLSSLHRRVWWSKAAQAGKYWTGVEPPDETELAEAEERILADAHRWGIHDADRGRLSILRQLAVLQHNHAPTRLIDVSFNIWVALWFATELSYANGLPVPDTTDGRLFVVDISDRLINETNERDWEDELSRPWRDSLINDWCSTTRAWRPAPADRRIAAQHGSFLLGGVPFTSAKQHYPKSPSSGKTGKWLSKDELRSCTSLPLRFHKANPKTGFKQSTAGDAYTIRITAGLKGDLRVFSPSGGDGRASTAA